jgi:hypothetical protein
VEVADRGKGKWGQKGAKKEAEQAGGTRWRVTIDLTPSLDKLLSSFFPFLQSSQPFPSLPPPSLSPSLTSAGAGSPGGVARFFLPLDSRSHVLLMLPSTVSDIPRGVFKSPAFCAAGS